MTNYPNSTLPLLSRYPGSPGNRHARLPGRFSQRDTLTAIRFNTSALRNFREGGRRRADSRLAPAMRFSRAGKKPAHPCGLADIAAAQDRGACWIISHPFQYPGGVSTPTPPTLTCYFFSLSFYIQVCVVCQQCPRRAGWSELTSENKSATPF